MSSLAQFLGYEEPTQRRYSPGVPAAVRNRKIDTTIGQVPPSPEVLHALTKHLPGPVAPRRVAPHIRLEREGLPSVSMSPGSYYKNGHPADRLMVGKPLTNGKITRYIKEGRYGPEYKKQLLAKKKRKTGKSRGKRTTSVEALEAFLGL